jgi:hypothetical protein
MSDFFQNIISFTGTPDVWTVFLLLLWCLIGEAGVLIPYVLESFWLLVGFNAGAGILSPWFIIVLWLAAQTGRQAGSLGLYRIARLGIPPLERFFQKIHLDKYFNKIKQRTGAVNRVNFASPFSVAFGRMVGMRIPMMLVMAGKKRPGILALGVLFSSIAWDALYISLGSIFGATVDIGQGYMLLVSLGCIGLMYLATFGIKRLIKHFRRPIPVPVTIAGTEK